LPPPTKTLFTSPQPLSSTIALATTSATAIAVDVAAAALLLSAGGRHHTSPVLFAAIFHFLIVDCCASTVCIGCFLGRRLCHATATIAITVFLSLW
jgi:hypothetical protein